MTSIDRIMREQGLVAADIEKITAFVSDNTLHHCGWPYTPDRVQSVLSAQMNLRYGLAVMALERQSGVEQFAESKIRDPRILSFIDRIEVAHEPRFEDGRYRVACRLVVRCKDGSAHETTTLYRPGSPEDPMTPGELMDKFLTLTKDTGDRRAGEIAQVVSQIEDCDTMTELSRLLTTGDEARVPD
jgi:2-methylcitrate dehydratase PrpD